MKTIKRRRKDHKTDYLKRIKLLKSGKPRIVFRRTNKYFLVQYVISKQAQDKILLGLNSKQLLKYGWPKEAEGSLKSITASYLTGFLTGKRIISKKLDSPIIDFGMIRAIHKAKPYAFLKGLIDSGIKINCKEEAFPTEERIQGGHLKNKIKFKEIKSKIENEK
ncbi:MAG: 50S ribosomal protein L18 [Nanoarchaeota archaeon]|nr:50S ribosomal protein L18 [Nanoarchaeota archaeon]